MNILNFNELIYNNLERSMSELAYKKTVKDNYETLEEENLCENCHGDGVVETGYEEEGHGEFIVTGTATCEECGGGGTII